MMMMMTMPLKYSSVKPQVYMCYMYRKTP